MQTSFKRNSLVPYMFLLPTMLGLLCFRLMPILWAMISSFTSVNFAGVLRWVGLSNYIFLFQDPNFWKSFWITIKWSLIVNPFQIIGALALAILVNQKLKGIGIFRTIYFVPITISLAIASTIWGLMYNPNSGLINSILAWLHIPTQPFLVSSKQALWCIVIIASWRSIGYWMMFMLAGLQGIPEELYEASKIDGANPWQAFWKVTLPMLKRTLAFVTVADTCSNFLIFVPMFILTNGGPEMSTNVLIYEAYNNAFIYGNRGISNAIVMSILTVILIVVGLEMRYLRSDH